MEDLIKERKRGQLQPISGMKRDITVDVSDSEAIRGYYEWLYIYSFENLEDMDTFVENYKFPKMKKKLISMVIFINMFVYK